MLMVDMLHYMHAGDDRMIEFAKVRDIKTSYILGQGKRTGRG